MFDPSDTPRVFALAPGVDFPRELVDGLTQRVSDQPPETLARVHLIVNTRRMDRRIRSLFKDGPPRLLPRISLLTELGDIRDNITLPLAVSPLRRRLELAQLISQLLDQQPDLAARASLYDLADSLAALMDEMNGEGVTADTIRKLEVTDMSGHWARAQSFFDIADRFVSADESKLDAQARQRRVVENLITRWQDTPPDHPIILAGSTGSRGTTLMLMDAVSRLPQGAVVLPGYDSDQPKEAWAQLDDPLASEDHPQYRFRNLMKTLGIDQSDIMAWSDTPAPSPTRNKLVSLALRPAPFTDSWLAEGPDLHDLVDATSRITMVSAPSPRAEALTIAMRLREAAENGQSAALITPDRMLTRQVSAALDRWNIVPDDSAGLPLHLSPPGRFLRHIAGLFCERLNSEMLLTLLKHPLCHSGDGRNDHLLHTRDLELKIRRYGAPFPNADNIAKLGKTLSLPEEWQKWLIVNFTEQQITGDQTLEDWVARLRRVAEQIATGGLISGSGELWAKKAGQAALTIITDLESEADAGGPMSARDFADLLGALLSQGEVRDRDLPRSGIMIWGTLEARVQGADLVILGGLNEGIWPEAARPDPWLNRKLRQEAGLLLPERRIGLSAHDFQQAIAAPEVWLTRSLRSEDTETVASRWLNRLTNLLGGLPEQDGPTALENMVSRGDIYLNWAEQIEASKRIDPAPRPSPCPPLAARPKHLSVTEIKRLIRDPYAIYAKHVLHLKPLNPLVQTPDALLRGTVLHTVLEKFIHASVKNIDDLTVDNLMTLSHEILTDIVPWPTARRLWLARIDRFAIPFLADELDRRKRATPIGFEVSAKNELKGLNFNLTGTADRIDRDADGALHIYDYKTGAPPTKKQQENFDKQLLLEAAIAEQGGFKDIDAAPVTRSVFIGLGSLAKEIPAPLAENPPATVWQDLHTLIAAYQSPAQGFTSRRMLFKDSDKGDYDQLARFGEWDRTTPPVSKVVS
ncbi:MAG: double-strand break repair protein AddB [Rhodobacteraceae bacterium]|nr:double-strand break repair protein AddB [Paracoccaceae bacterium]